MKSFLNIFSLILLCSFSAFAQTSGNGGSSPWVVLTSQYPTSPFNDTTEVQVYFDGSSYSGYVTSLQFKVDYDGVTFDSLYSIQNNLSSDYVLTYNEDVSNDEVLISIVYTGSSTTTSFPDTAIVTLKFDHVPVKLLYSNQQNITPFTFAGYTAGGSNVNGTDISVGTHSHGGAAAIPHRKFSGNIIEYGTSKGLSGLEYQLYRNNSLITTVLGGSPTTTNSAGYYEMVYYEHYYGTINNSSTDFDFLFKSEPIDSDAAISTADSYKVLLYANDQISLNAYQRLASDVNHSHTSTIADSYVLYSYNAGAYNNWTSFGSGGYRDVMFIKPEDVKYLEDDSTTVVSGVGTGPLGFSPQETNWTYDLNAYNGITDLTENFYVIVMGDVNLTSLGGSSVSPKVMPSIERDFTNVSTSIVAQLPDQKVTVGDYFTVELTLNTEGVDVHSFDFELEYDVEVLEFVEASTPYLPNAWQLFFNTDSVGQVSYGGLDASVGNYPIRTDEPETIIEFEFRAKQLTGIGETPIEFGNNYNTGNRIGDDLETVVIDGKVYLHVISPVLDPIYFPRGYKLEQNYPNPFNPGTKIGFTIVNPQVVTIDIYTLDGRFVETIFNDIVGTGYHETYFNADNLPSGVYLYKLSTNTGSITKKMTLIK
jgi:hypothetical protein